MSDIFENELDNENINLSSLEDGDSDLSEPEYVNFDRPLLMLKMEHSSETLFARDERNLAVKTGDFVFVQTRYGKDMVRVMGTAKKPVGVKLPEVVTIERKATADDLALRAEYARKEQEAFKIFKEKVTENNLDMKLISVHFLQDEPKVLFFFSSDNRVDFRELVKDLVAVFKIRIELRQIGVRDESRITGGLGVCGRPFCCHGVSDRLRPVSIRMAKEQNLSLNSLKISGHCGRLLCCLSYEADWYSEARKKLPPEGLRVFYDGTNFKIIEVNLITSMIQMLGEDGRLLEVNAKQFSKSGGRWKLG